MAIRRAGLLFRLAWALPLALLVASAGVLVAQGQGQKKDDKKLDESQKKETQAVIKLVDDVVAGQPAPNDLGVTWVREDFLKAAGNKEYTPFVVTLDPSKATGGPVTFYWRVISKSAPTSTDAAGTSGKKAEKKDENKDNKKRDFPYEDRSFVPVSGNGPMQIARSFTVPAGSYDVYVAVKESTSAQKGAAPPKASVIKQTVTVPDFWNGKLSTSSLIVAQRIDPLPAPLTPEQQADRPYAMGAAELVPSLDNKIGKSAEFRVFFLIYNPKTDSNNKPNVVVEYNFCQPATGAEPKAGEPCKAGEKFFNKTNALNLNADTLPPQFDLAAGHQLQGSQGISLATFPAGDYRLEIKVTDKVGNETLVREVTFTVTAS